MKSSKQFSGNPPVIRCRCGAQIQMLPSVKSMSKAIEAHIEEHKNKAKSRREAEIEGEQLLQDLVTKVLVKASE